MFMHVVSGPCEDFICLAKSEFGPFRGYQEDFPTYFRGDSMEFFVFWKCEFRINTCSRESDVNPPSSPGSLNSDFTYK